MNKRGDIFNLYFIIFVVILCVVVVASYINLQNETKKIIISPEPLLKLEDELKIFEYNEMLIAKQTIINQGFDISIFCTNLEDYSNFLKEDLYHQGTFFSKEFLETASNWDSFCNMIYSTKVEGDTLILKRDTLTKKFRMDNPNRTEKQINYPIDVSFDYEKEYKFSLTSGEVIR